MCPHGSPAVASGCVHRSAPAEPLPDVRSHSEGADGRYAVGESPFVLLAIHEVSNGRYSLQCNSAKLSYTSIRLFVNEEGPRLANRATEAGRDLA